MSKQSDAIRLWIIENGISQKDFAESINIQPPTLSNFLKGRRKFTSPVAEAMYKKYGILTEFTLYGRGEMFCHDVNIIKDVSKNYNCTIGNNISTTDGNAAALEADNASLRAENERLRNEVDWLREQLSKR